MRPLTPRPSPPGWLPFAVLAAAGAYLTLRWDSIPARWVVHWDAGGTPNGWAGRTALGVYGPLLFGAAVILVLEVVSMFGRGTADEPTEPVRAATRHMLRTVALAVSVMLALLAIDLPLGPPLPVAALVALCVAPILAALVSGVRRMSRALEEIRRSGHAARLEGYHGLYYASASDPRLWVPKLGGTGLTINFAHPWAWPVMLLLAGVPIAAAIVALAR